MSKRRTSSNKRRARSKASARRPADADTTVGRRRIRRFLWLFLPLLALAIFVGISRGKRARPSAPNVVAPQDRDGIDPLVLKLIDRHMDLVRQSPRSADTHGKLGMVYEANGMLREAAACYEAAEHLQPGEPAWPFHRAVMIQQLGQVREGLRVLKRLAAAHPKYASLQQHYGERLLEAGDWPGAARAFQRVIDTFPKSAKGYLGLGEVRLREREYESARPLLEQAVALKPSDKNARYLLGMVYRGLGMPEAARRELATGEGAKRSLMRDDLSRQIEEFAVNLTGQLRLSRRYEALGDLKSAAAILDRALQRRPNDAGITNNLASLYTRLGRLDDALRLLQRAKTLPEQRMVTYFNLTNCFLALERSNEALVSAEMAIRLGPRVAKCHLIKAVVLNRTERHEEALAALATAARCDPANARIFLETAKTLFSLRRYAEALPPYRRAARMEPHSLNAQIG
ncbi:MAG: tetratricopeptide repeat protein, partial [Phycisphaerae bacterium]